MVVVEPSEAREDEPVTFHASWDPNVDHVENYSERFGLRCVFSRQNGFPPQMRLLLTLQPYSFVPDSG